MFGSIIMLISFILVPVVLFFWNYHRCSSKVLGCFLDEVSGFQPRLCKISGDDWLLYDDGAYRLDSESVRWTRYPFGWPSALQQSVPALLYKKGDMNPLDWSTVNIDPKQHVSAREIGALLEPEWLRALVKGVKETSGGLSQRERIFTFVGAGASVLALIMIFVLLTRL